MKTSHVFLIAYAAFTTTACVSTASYRVLPSDAAGLVAEGAKPIQQVEADSPIGDSFVVVIYYGSDVAPTVKAGGDSETLVRATAAVARKALRLLLLAK